MKIIVMSDSHGADSRIVTAIKENPDADRIVFLGDGERDLDSALAECGISEFNDALGREVYRVCGNCDWFSKEPASVIGAFGGVRMLITHGFEQNVKYGYEALAKDAKRRKCEWALFGHTHVPYYGIINNVKLFNPGSLRSGKYGVLTVRNGSVEFEHRSL